MFTVDRFGLGSPKFKGTKYKEAWKRVDLHASVSVDLPLGYELARIDYKLTWYELTWVRLDQTPILDHRY